MNKAQKCQMWFTRLRQNGAWGDCGFLVIGKGVTHTHTNLAQSDTETKGTRQRTNPWLPNQLTNFLCNPEVTQA